MSSSASAATRQAVATLSRHPDSPAMGVDAVDAMLAWRPGGAWSISYVVRGAIDRLRIPERAGPASRRDGLWQHTCFELFVGNERDASYREYNFAPSGDWAAYAFCRYRERTAWDDDGAEPDIRTVIADGRLEQQVLLPANALPVASPGERLVVGVTAVIESVDGRLAYWALSHVPGKPDFHRAGTFALPLISP
ncbi:MAG: DOMON-like domain-containing protein [Burkholderiales bacterium]